MEPQSTYSLWTPACRNSGCRRTSVYDRFGIFPSKDVLWTMSVIWLPGPLLHLERHMGFQVTQFRERVILITGWIDLHP